MDSSLKESKLAKNFKTFKNVIHLKFEKLFIEIQNFTSSNSNALEFERKSKFD